MHPLEDAASSFSAAPAEGSRFEPLQQEEDLGGAAAASPSPPSRSRGTRAGRENAGIIRCQDSQQRSERQQTLAASATTAAVDVDVEPMPVPNKRPRRTALPSVAAAPTTTSSVDQPMIAATTALERFAREVSLDAVFRRVRLGGGPEAPEEVAYYTTVTIAGHVFRGVLYDAGPCRHSGISRSAAASDTDGGSAGEEGSSSLSTAGDSCLDLALGL